MLLSALSRHYASPGEVQHCLCCVSIVVGSVHLKRSMVMASLSCPAKVIIPALLLNAGLDRPETVPFLIEA